MLNDADRAHIELVDVATGKLTRPTTASRIRGGAALLAGRQAPRVRALRGRQPDHLTEAWVAALGEGNGTAISHPFDRAVHDVAWLPDSSGIVFTAHDGTTNAIVRATLAAGTNAPHASTSAT